MANTLTNLIPDAYAALDVVSREMVGLIPTVMRDASCDRLAKDQTLYIDIAPAATSGDVSPAMSLPAAADQTIGNVAVTIDAVKYSRFSWNGEEAASVTNFGGAGALTMQQGQIAQSMRKLVNDIEAELAGLYIYASRAYGTAGTTPFGTAGDFTDLSNVLRILDENGAPEGDRHVVLDSVAKANLLGKQSHSAVQFDGSFLKQGVLLPLMGADIRASGQMKSVAGGTAASSTTNTAGYAIGATTITLASAGTGTIVAGDAISFAGDSNKYIVASGDADVSGGGTITLAAPGLLKAIPASATAITVLKNTTVPYPRSMAFSRNAILLATRLPYLPPEGDMALDRQTIVDTRSGLAFDLAVYGGYRMNVYELSIAYGKKVIKPEHLAILAG